MLGLHTNGVHIIGGSPTILDALKKNNIPTAKTLTSNTLVFAINETVLLKKKFYAISFATAQAPWFVCTIGDFDPPTKDTLAFESESDFIDFVIAIYYASQGFLHLDFEVSTLKNKLSQHRNRKIKAVSEDRFSEIPKDAFIACFCFSKGGFMESDRLFQELKTVVDMGNILLAGTFDSKYTFIRGFIL